MILPIKQWNTIEVEVTPKLLRAWANMLAAEMEQARLGAEVPTLTFRDYTTWSVLVFRADQAAWHNKSKGEWE